MVLAAASSPSAAQLSATVPLVIQLVVHWQLLLPEQQLLALSSSLQDGSTFIRRARGLVEASQRAVSAYLLDTDSQQTELEEVAKHSLSHRLDDVVQL